MGELFRDYFHIATVDKEGKLFDRVSRVEGKSETYDCEMILDINSEIYPITAGDRILAVLATSLSLDAHGAGDQETQQYWRQNAPGINAGGMTGTTTSRADGFEYVMYGKVFKIEDTAGSKLSCSVIISFGGLLLQLKGSYKHLNYITKGSNVYLLITKEQ